MTAFSETTRKSVRERSRGKCDLCGMPVSVAHFHHRRPRAMGGTRRRDSGTASNCLVVHPSCHAMIELSRQRSLDNGWLVSQYQDPPSVPVKLWFGWAYLTDDGSVLHKVPDVDAAADRLPDERVGSADADGSSGDHSLDGSLAHADQFSDVVGSHAAAEKVEADSLER